MTDKMVKFLRLAKVALFAAPFVAASLAPARVIYEHKVVRRSHKKVVVGSVGAPCGDLAGTGPLVTGVIAGSPAASAGLEPGDLIQSVNGAAVANCKQVASKVNAMTPGSSLTLTYTRKGSVKSVQMTVGEMAEVYADGSPDWLGDDPVVVLPTGNNEFSYIEGTKAGGEEALGFPAMDRWGCAGLLEVAGDRVAFEPMNPHSEHCQGSPATLSRSEVRSVKTGKGGYVGIRARHSSIFASLQWFEMRPVLVGSPAVRGAPADARKQLFDRFNQAFSDFASAQNQFRKQIAPLFWIESREALAGDSALEAGEQFNALHDYEAALESLPIQWGPSGLQKQLREKIIKLALGMNPPPAIPQDASRYEAYSVTAWREATGASDMMRAAAQMERALTLAPWWGSAYRNLALLLVKAGRDADAASNLKLYLLAEPNAPDAETVQSQIYSLQYQAQHPPYLGVALSDISSNRRELLRLGLTDANGAMVDKVAKDGPAAEAGVEPDDVIRTFNGLTVSSQEALLQMIQAIRPGTSVTLGIVRGGKPLSLPVMIGARP